MKIKLSISVLFLTYFGALKCTNELEINLPHRAAEVCSDDGFEAFNGICYKLMEGNLTFVQSQTDCAAIVPTNTAKLASVNNFETNQFLLNMVKPRNLLLGLKYNAASGVEQYEWDGNSSPYNFSNFPSEYEHAAWRDLLGDCVMMKQTGEWINKDCEEEDLPHICQIPAEEKPSEEPPTETPPDKCPKINLFANSGIITSPGYPYRYNGNSGALNCSYTLIAAKGKTLDIYFTELSSCGTGNSVFYIYKGVDEQPDNLIRNITGDLYSLPLNISIPTNSMFIRFASNGQGKWRAVWGPSA